jgi:uroporphyrin-3 C-methyltransferase
MEQDSKTDFHGDARPEGAEPAAQPNPPATPAPRSRRRVATLAFIAMLLALVLAALFWIDTRNRIELTREEVARRLRDAESDSREARALARSAQDTLRDAQARLAQVEARLAESQSQQLALESLYQELARNRDEWQLAEIEQMLAIASQQLQLSGNVRAALLALQLAESRLARADRPQFQSVRRALARDIERLKALPAVDVPGMSIKLDRLIAASETLPLAFEERTGKPPAAKRAEAPAEGWWTRFSGQLWAELRQLVVVQRVDAPQPELLPPTQAYFLRENLRLRLLNARLSLLARDEAGYRSDLRAARAWIGRYFEPRAKSVAEAVSLVNDLTAASMIFQPPEITDSLEAVRAFKARRER